MSDIPAALPSIAAGETDRPLLTSTIGANLDATIARFAEREALVDCEQGIRWTYGQFGDEVVRLARALVASGVTVGDRVGIWAPNCAEWTVLQYATAKIGAILVTINPAYRTHELEFVLNQAGISHLVAATAFRTSDYQAMVAAVRDNCPGLREVTYIASDSWRALVARAQEVPAD